MSHVVQDIILTDTILIVQNSYLTLINIFVNIIVQRNKCIINNRTTILHDEDHITELINLQSVCSSRVTLNRPSSIISSTEVLSVTNSQTWSDELTTELHTILIDVSEISVINIRNELTINE